MLLAMTLWVAPEGVKECAGKLTRKPPSHKSPDMESESSVAWLLPFGLLVMAIIAVPLLILSEEGLPRYKTLSAEVTALKRDNGRLREEVLTLEREANALRTDPATLESIARDELGMVREGEIVIQF